MGKFWENWPYFKVCLVFKVLQFYSQVTIMSLIQRLSTIEVDLNNKQDMSKSQNLDYQFTLKMVLSIFVFTVIIHKWSESPVGRQRSFAGPNSFFPAEQLNFISELNFVSLLDFLKNLKLIPCSYSINKFSPKVTIFPWIPKVLKPLLNWYKKACTFHHSITMWPLWLACQDVYLNIINHYPDHPFEFYLETSLTMLAKNNFEL